MATRPDAPARHTRVLTALLAAALAGCSSHTPAADGAPPPDADAAVTPPIDGAPPPPVDAGTPPADAPPPPPTDGAADAGGAVDLCMGLVRDTARHPMTPLARPAVGVAVTDPEFHTTIRRITSVAASGADPALVPMYSTMPAWNADESRLILYQVGAGHRLYDGRTYAFIRDLAISPADVEQVYWHPTDPDVLLYVERTALVRYHVAAGVREQVATFAPCTSAASFGGDPMYMSWDGDVLGVECNGTDFVYRVSTRAVLGSTRSTRLPPQVAPSGALAFWAGDVVDPSMRVLRTLDLAAPDEHASLGRLAAGHDTYNASAYDPGPRGSGVGALVTYDLTDGTSRVIVGPSTGYPYPPSGVHISAVALRRPGWVWLSVIGDPAGAGVLDSEILVADTNTGTVCRVAHHRSYGRANTHLATPYWAEPHVVVSPSGTRALFGSDWGNNATVDTYVVELPSYR